MPSSEGVFTPRLGPCGHTPKGHTAASPASNAAARRRVFF
jgi:hypothetical protein